MIDFLRKNHRYALIFGGLSVYGAYPFVGQDIDWLNLIAAFTGGVWLTVYLLSIESRIDEKLIRQTMKNSEEFAASANKLIETMEQIINKQQYELDILHQKLKNPR